MNRRSASALALEGRRRPASVDHQGQLPSVFTTDGTLCAEGSRGRRLVSPVGGRPPCRPHRGPPRGVTCIFPRRLPASVSLMSPPAPCRPPAALPPPHPAAPDGRHRGDGLPLLCTAPGSALLTPPGEGVGWSFSAYEVGKSALGRKVHLRLLFSKPGPRADCSRASRRPPGSETGRRSHLAPALPRITERQSQTPREGSPRRAQRTDPRALGSRPGRRVFPAKRRQGWEAGPGRVGGMGWTGQRLRESSTSLFSSQDIMGSACLLRLGDRRQGQGPGGQRERHLRCVKGVLFLLSRGTNCSANHQ